MIEPEFLVIIICISFIGFVLIGYKNHVADWGASLLTLSMAG